MSLISAIALLSVVGASFASPAGNSGSSFAHNRYTTTAHAAGPTPPGTAANCGAYHLVTEGETCLSIGMSSGLTTKEFQSLNPAINADCTNLVPGYEYCVGKVNQLIPRDTPAKPLSDPTPSPTTPPAQTPVNTYVPAPGPTKPGTSTCCLKWHTCAENDTCQSIDNDAGITYSEFRAWNPDVNGACTNLWIGYSYCVDADDDCSATGSSPTTTTTSSPTTRKTPIATPTPVQVGMVAGCTQFYQAQGGDYCQAIAWRFGIDVATFLSWNPGVGRECHGLLIGYYYCVAK